VTRQPDFSTLPRRPRSAGWEWLLLALGALALAVSAASAWRARAEATEARLRLAETTRQLELESARGGHPARGAGAGSGAAAVVPPLRVVASLASVLPGDVRLSALSIRYGPAVSVELQVEARSAASWDRLLAGLERSPDFRDVEPGPENRAAEVRSVVRARWAGATR
jgi:hypothetical protein